MISNTRAVVLSHLRYGDSNLIVNLYTECKGRQTVFVKGAFGKKSPTRAALFQPLHLIETDLHHRVNREMQRVSNAQLFYLHRNIPFDPVKSCIAMFIAEILHKTLKEEEPNSGLFGFLTDTIQTLDLSDCGTANFHLMFLIHYSRYLGFYPNTEHAADHAWHISQNPLMMQLLGMSFEHLDGLQISHYQRNYLTEFLLDYYSVHVDNFGKVKSFPVLRNVFQD